MSSPSSVIVHYQEIALKGRNRPWFIARLVRNLREVTRGLGVTDVRALMGRIELTLGNRQGGQARGTGTEDVWPELKTRLARVFGIANYSLARRVSLEPLDLDAVAGAILADLGERHPASFRVAARRADKRFPLTSPRLEYEVGGRIKDARGWRVDLTNPELIIHLEVLSHEAFYFFDKERGAGGLPTGVSGRVACLLSGGIDSPVAAYRMMRRGCPVALIHFHSYPILSRASQEKVRELAALLARYQLRSKLYLVAFGEIQQQIVLTVPGPMRVVVYRRLMLRIAERLARAWGARALVTGEVIGQVASQTLENMSVIGQAATLPILRPLVGMDKDEITAEAQRLGTYSISIIPDQDCCTLFTPRHPTTRARVHEVDRAEAALALDALVAAAAESAVVEEFRFPMLESQVAVRDENRRS
jgi:tRNA uracil 4-sulfurtransferase